MIRDDAGIVNSGLWFVVAMTQRLRQIIKRIRHFRIVRILRHDFFKATDRGRIGLSEVIKITDPVHTLREHFLDSPQLLLCLVEKRTIGIIFDHPFQFRFGQQRLCPVPIRLLHSPNMGERNLQLSIVRQIAGWKKCDVILELRLCLIHG